MSFDIYAEYIMSHATKPHNNKVMDGVVGVHADNPVCGDELMLYIKKENDILKEATFTGVCCALSTASASIFTDYLRGKKIVELKSLSPGDLYDLFGITVAPSRSNCVLLVYRALENWLIEEDSKKQVA
jgi:nitrogen fixation protein NifU and related proteins